MDFFRSRNGAKKCDFMALSRQVYVCLKHQSGAFRKPAAIFLRSHGNIFMVPATATR